MSEIIIIFDDTKADPYETKFRKMLRTHEIQNMMNKIKYWLFCLGPCISYKEH